MTTQKPLDLKWLLPVLLALLSLGISAYIGYAATDREMAQRVTTTEVQQVNDHKTLDEIKADVRETKQKVTEILILLGTKH